MALTPEEELDVQTAARLAGRTAETIRRWVWSGRLKAHKRGNKLIVRKSDVERLARSGSQAALSLRGWAEMARKGLEDFRGTHSSAADLVLDERARRLEGDRT